MLLLLVGCAQPTPASQPTATAAPPPATLAPVAVVTPTAPPPAPTRAAPTATTRAAPTPTTAAQARNLKTFHALISFDTYETEETVQLELGRLPGVTSINVTQLDVTVQYDASRLSEDEILRTLRDNPEVRIKDDTRAGN